MFSVKTSHTLGCNLLHKTSFNETVNGNDSLKFTTISDPRFNIAMHLCDPFCSVSHTFQITLPCVFFPTPSLSLQQIQHTPLFHVLIPLWALQSIRVWFRSYRSLVELDFWARLQIQCKSFNQPVHLNRLSRLYFVAKRLAQPYKTARYDTERHLQLRSSRIALLCVTHGFRKAAEKLTIMDTWHVHDVSLEGTHLYGSNYLHIFSVLKFVTDQFPKKISCTTNT